MSTIPKGYLTTAQAKQLLNVDRQTLIRWSDSGKIDFIKPPGRYTNRRYNVKKFVTENTPEQFRTRYNFCYCRVSTHNQLDDLQRQIEFMRRRYPSYTIITDIGSGLNFKRKGFQNLIDKAIQGQVNEIVVAYKDRLCRFGFELVNHIVTTYSNGKIVVLKQVKLSPQEEMVTDVLTILNVFSTRLNGLRKYKAKISEDQDITHNQTEKNL